MSGLEDKIVVVTGAGRGLGAAFATSLAMAGCRLILCGRRMGDLETVGRAVTRLSGHHPDLVTLDLADAPSVRDAVKQIEARLSHVDILINNAAMWLESSTEPYEDNAVLQVINSAMAGTFLFTQGLRSLMEASEAPDVVTIGSISGLPNAALQSVSVPFYAAKHGQTALAEGLRQTFAGTDFRSILVNPPYLDDVQPDHPDWKAAGQRRKGQRGTGRDVIEAVIFALTRPRHVSLTIDIDADEGGLHPR
ncbi:NADP-dependent 3-hydroxy acid dehydrogenase YdfG [Nitratireductor aquibiodomus]|uniref:NADP-dependent 3-hydroxy acid dehydrogenase YdfG n=1 Tax=Nitratireductor aquibiodomus TaxID=204799 RepID=A0A1H4K3Y4_9HYPH|nr:SDR family NAD(P)-dependent oxidoreductase [Nitratireductor aquibiodomus]SEB52825.1 NADP-dependent 3-hydroxy acid dehydrogenase YdfG [Nitratireductor aquibiodomus]